MNIWSGTSDPSVTGTVVAVTDIGIAATNPDFSNQLWDGAACLSYT